MKFGDFIERREDDLDIEIAASGFSKKMADELNQEFEDAYDEDLGDCDVESSVDSDEDTNTDENRCQGDDKEKKDVVCQEQLCNIPVKQSDGAYDNLEETMIHLQISNNDEDYSENNLNDLNEGEGSYEDFAPVTGTSSLDDDAPDYEDSYSVSTATTIAPDVIRSRVKKAIKSEQQKQIKRRARIKGECSAVNRSRRVNREVIRDSVRDHWDE